MDLSIINYYGKSSSRCGYCKGQKSSKSHGMHAYTLTPQDYQDLIDRGWRRSGQYCYKPHNPTTCCPCYTIKCDALQFKLSKSHKKVLKRMNRFLRDGKVDKNEEASTSNHVAKNEGNIDVDIDVNDEPKAPNVPVPKVDLDAVKATNSTNKITATHRNQQKESKPKATTIDAEAIESSTSTSFCKQPCDKQNLQPKKAKQIRLERRQAKLALKGGSTEDLAKSPKTQNLEKTLVDYLNETTPADKHKLKIILKPSATLKVEQQTFNLYRKYQMSIHNDPPERVTPTRLERFLYATPLKHHQPDDGPPQGYGSFHQQYWLDDKLIAVGVIDILPYCVSSVYFFYDPEYSFLSLGTYASLREIEFVQQFSRLVPALKYYYMGFYIHSCPKMRYKGKLVPSYLVCPETYTWHLLTDEIRCLLDAHKYQRFNLDPAAKDINEFTENDLNEVLLLLENNICATYGQYLEIIGGITGDGDIEERDMISEYGKLVGKICAHRMVFVKM